MTLDLLSGIIHKAEKAQGKRSLPFSAILHRGGKTFASLDDRNCVEFGLHSSP